MSESLLTDSDVKQTFINQSFSNSVESKLKEIVTSFSLGHYDDCSTKQVVKSLYHSLRQLQRDSSLIRRKHERALAILKAIKNSLSLELIKEESICKLYK